MPTTLRETASTAAPPPPRPCPLKAFTPKHMHKLCLGFLHVLLELVQQLLVGSMPFRTCWNEMAMLTVFFRKACAEKEIHITGGQHVSAQPTCF